MKITQTEINFILLIVILFIVFMISCLIFDKIKVLSKRGFQESKEKPFIVEKNDSEFINKVQNFKF